MASPKKQVLVCGIVHETNTYATPISGLTPLSNFHQLTGPKIIKYHRHSKTITGGFLAAAAELDYDIIPGYLAATEPSGTITDQAYEFMKAQIIHHVHQALRSTHGLDAVALDLHGAGVAESYEDIEADLGAAIRDIIGPDIKMICALDLHGNIHDRMVDSFDYMVGFKLYPHEDQYEAGHQAFSLLPRLFNNNLQPHTHIEHLPITLPTTSTDPGFASHRMNEFVQNVIDKYRSEPYFASEEILDLTVYHGFPYSDVSHVGVHIVCSCSVDLSNARDAAREVAYWIWTHRDEFVPQHPTPTEVVAEALTLLNHHNPSQDPSRLQTLGPVTINETNDNTGCGAPGDGTFLLQAMIDGGLGKNNTSKRNTVFGYFCDAECVQACIRSGVGSTVRGLGIGGKTGDLHGATVYVDAYVSKITDGRFVLTSYAPGMRCNLGPTVLVTLVDSGIDVIVTSGRQQTFGRDIFYLHGLGMHAYDVIAVKSSVHFRAGFRGLSLQILTCDSPGLTTCLVEKFDHTKTDEKGIELWPKNVDTTWKPGMYSSSHRRNMKVLTNIAKL